jgi:hypothetical protein
MDLLLKRCFSTAVATACLLLPALDAEATSTGEDEAYAWFASPLPNAEYDEVPTTLDVDIDVHQGFSDSIETMQLAVDGSYLAAIPCESGCTFAGIVLGEGEHHLALLANNGASRSTMVYVGIEAPTNPPPMPGDESEGEDDGDLEFDDSEGKGCSMGGASGSPGALLALLPIFTWRRRRLGRV